MSHKVLFVCTGNTCRSPMAEALFRHMANERGLDVEVKSAGVAAFDGQAISAHAKNVLTQRGVDVQDFRSTSLDEDLVNWADLILTMTSQHKRMLLEAFPSAVDKTYALKEYADTDGETEKLHAERESLIAELQIQMSLDQPIGQELQTKLAALEQKLPRLDISDPIGGDLSLYEQTASEIEAALRVVLHRLAG